MSKKTLCMTGLIGLLMSGGAFAEGVEAGIGYAGYENPWDVDDSKGPKASLGYRYNGAWGVEVSHADIDAAVENNKDGFTHTALNALYHFSEGSTQPYFIAGAGSYAGNGALNAGLGLKQRMGNFILRPEIGLVKALSESNGTDTVNSTASLTLSYLFGSSSSKKAPVIVKKPVETLSPSDSDGDSIVDTADRCPATPKGVSVDSYGCALDSDSDGVADYMDNCPQTEAGLKIDSSGCPMKLAKDVAISLNVNFDSGSTVVKEAYYDEIAKAADFLRQYKDSRVVIEGHTDTRGSAAFNKKLSQKRADSVASVLVKAFGIAQGRVSAIGYGEERPISDESTQEGLLRNRRVVANIKAVIESFEKK